MARPHIEPWLVKGPKNIRMAQWLNALLAELAEKMGISQDSVIAYAILKAFPWAAKWRDDWIKTQEMRQAE